MTRSEQRRVSPAVDGTRGRRENGVILAVVMILLAVLLLWWGALFGYAYTISRLGSAEAARRQACWTARSGALHGYLVLENARRPHGRFLPPSVTPVGGLEYKVEFQQRGPGVEIISRGAWGRVVQERRWLVAIPPGGKPGGYVR